MRKDYRDFRFDRITDLCITNQQYEDKHPSLKSYLEKMSPDKNLTEITICVSLYAARHLGEQKYYHGFTGEKETADGMEMIFLTYSLEGFARWYLMFPIMHKLFHLSI